ncbi:MAG TPA: ABC transporter ATP-binding protein [Rhodoglobus sp.]|nr:ABC transporter ATP-binding protein [Rhodoglobus sp.]
MAIASQHALIGTGLRLQYEGRVVVDGLDVSVPAGGITVVVGANASGKSTLLRGLAGLLRPTAGAVELDGRDIRGIPSREFARSVGLLPQQPVAPEAITVADLVGRGRYPHQRWFRTWRAEDDAAVAAALDATDTAAIAGRRVDELSGGQRQRVWIALALAQDPDILLLDEPTTFLDIAHQVEVLDLLLHLNRERGTTVVMVLHDLNLAARYADRMLVMADGALVASGAPADVLTADLVRTAFGMDCMVVPDPVTGSPLVVPVGRFHPGPQTP